MKKNRLLVHIFLVGVFVFTNSCDFPTEPKDTVEQWESINNSVLSNLTIQAIAVPEQSVNTVYVGTFKGVFKSTDTGKNWKNISNGLTSLDITSLAIDPQNVNNIFCSSWGKGAYMSQNGGEEWQPIWQANNDPRISEIAATADGGTSTVWAATENGVYKTSDFNNWEKSFPQGRILSIAASPVDAKTLFLSVRYKGNYRTIDAGESWNDVNDGMHATSDGIAAANSFAFNYSNKNQVILSTGWIDLFQSHDKGSTWEKFAEKLEHLDVVCIASDKRKPNVLWAATDEHGVYKSRDSGSTWIQFNEGLGTLAMKKICVITGSKSIVYAGTEGNGIYKYVMD